MSFSSALFIVYFMPAVLALYWLVPRKAWLQNTVLLLASYIYYFSYGPKMLGLFVFTALVNYGLLKSLRKPDAEGVPENSKSILRLGLVYNLGQLVLLKYLGFFASTAAAIAQVLGLSFVPPVLSWGVPIGISFWTLQLVAYVTDVSYGRRAGPKSLLDFATFVAFFPQILSGPIARGDLIDQLEKPRAPSAERFARGAQAFLLGFSMKFLVSAFLGPFVDQVYLAPANYTLTAHWLVLYLYTCQIFCDFAGYSLLALGVAEFFGIGLVENFRFPFLARNISDFWKRWHISLTNFLFDYIYSPLVTGEGRLRGKLGAGLFIVLLVSGIWHGATWMFVLWGALHGFVLMTAHRWDEYYRTLCRKDRVWVQRRKSRAYVVTSWLLTQGWFMFSLVPFRAPDLKTAGTFTLGLLGAANGAERIELGAFSNKLNFLLCMSFVVFYHLSATEPAKRLRELAARVPAPLRGFAYGTVVVYLFLFKPLSEGSFIYAQF
ncbi:MAG: MBOAT family O-acyltransferase [Myxococcales bacterium]